MDWVDCLLRVLLVGATDFAAVGYCDAFVRVCEDPKLLWGRLLRCLLWDDQRHIAHQRMHLEKIYFGAGKEGGVAEE